MFFKFGLIKLINVYYYFQPYSGYQTYWEGEEDSPDIYNQTLVLGRCLETLTLTLVIEPPTLISSVKLVVNNLNHLAIVSPHI